MIYKKILTLIFIFTTGYLYPRNPRRKVDTTTPIIEITASDHKIHREWHTLQDEHISKKYLLKNNFLRLRPIKNGFDEQFFKENFLPQDNITFRSSNDVVTGAKLSELAHNLIEEIKNGNREFTHFKVLKDSGFNYNSLSGLIVLKYKDYPFVIKVSIEHPHTIIKPFSKSYEASGIFVMGGNLRHLTNFTRITNLKRIKELLCFNPFYLYNLDFPRKWYWKPDNGYDLLIDWKCGQQKDFAKIPSIYAVIADFIITEEYQPTHELNRLSMKVATDVGFLIDPHAGNILIEKDTRKYILLDTENFRLMIGLDTPMNAKKYIGWYIELLGRSSKTCFLRNKTERIEQAMQL
jgi:hypothetical protein